MLKRFTLSVFNKAEIMTIFTEKKYSLWKINGVINNRFFDLSIRLGRVRIYIYSSS